VTESRYLHDALRDRVLARLGLARPPSTDLVGLREIYSAWCQHVPFDNLRKRIHVVSGSPEALPGDSCEDFFAAWLRHGVGGTCWAGNGALCALLGSSGFNVRRAIATMLSRPTLLPNHGTVLVAVEGRDYLVDASVLHGEPLPLDAQRETRIEHPAWGVRAIRRDGRWHVRWRPLHFPDGIDCRIEQLSASEEEFRCAHEATRAWSPFNFEIHFRRLRGESLVGFAMGRYVEIDGAGRVTDRPVSSDERNRMLVAQFGIAESIVAQLPADVPTPPPPGSRTAASLPAARDARK
jgi:N-hydroxyarylamine O-acetyltransferase